MIIRSIIVDLPYFCLLYTSLKYVYLPTVPRDKAKRSAVKHLVDTFFKDAPDQVVAALLLSLIHISTQTIMLVFRNSNRQCAHINSLNASLGDKTRTPGKRSSAERKSATLFVTIAASPPATASSKT